MKGATNLATVPAKRPQPSGAFPTEKLMPSENFRDFPGFFASAIVQLVPWPWPSMTYVSCEAIHRATSVCTNRVRKLNTSKPIVKKQLKQLVQKEVGALSTIDSPSLKINHMFRESVKLRANKCQLR